MVKQLAKFACGNLEGRKVYGNKLMDLAKEISRQNVESVSMCF